MIQYSFLSNTQTKFNVANKINFDEGKPSGTKGNRVHSHAKFKLNSTKVRKANKLLVLFNPVWLGIGRRSMSKVLGDKIVEKLVDCVAKHWSLQ